MEIGKRALAKHTAHYNVYHPSILKHQLNITTSVSSCITILQFFHDHFEYKLCTIAE